MSLTAYDPDPMLTAGKSAITVVKTIADIKAPKASELNAATSVSVQCATEAFGSTTEVTMQARKMLCDQVAAQKPGNRTYNIEALTIMMGDPQATANPAYEALAVLDSVVYLVHRPGKTHTEPYASGDKVQVIKAQVASVDLRSISTAEGDEYAFTAAFSVLERTQLFGTVAA